MRIGVSQSRSKGLETGLSKALDRLCLNMSFKGLSVGGRPWKRPGRYNLVVLGLGKVSFWISGIFLFDI